MAGLQYGLTNGLEITSRIDDNGEPLGPLDTPACDALDKKAARETAFCWSVVSRLRELLHKTDTPLTVAYVPVEDEGHHHVYPVAGNAAIFHHYLLLLNPRGLDVINVFATRAMPC